MARGDDTNASGSRKRPRLSRAGRASMGAVAGSANPAVALPHHNSAVFGPGLSADDVHGPLNLLRVNGHRDPGRYAIVPEETQVLFDKDPEQDTLLWFPAPPMDGPTQVARQKFTFVNAPLHSLDYMYQRIVQQQEQQRTASESALLVAPQDALAEVEPPTKNKSTHKRGKNSRKRKAPAVAHAGVAQAASDQVEEEVSNGRDLVDDHNEELLSQEEAEALLLRGIQALNPAPLQES
ncbi:hypothetical protein CF327_g5408 [Tilletia walkeri]|uniref:Uncharacterized protein n=1 Tax=Tilletia walkeri TaxID=117179 RepID=A0A8X7N626_9BASI|nr:hypothetical protein CF327_g5408 [Tilletia walkeri]KAE8266361.1 hypothetical protein A4X09_0g5989 [Tilletia walkeri]